VSEAASAVRWLFQQDEPEARRVAVKQIAKVRGHAVAELLMRALSDDDWRVRKEGAAVAPLLEPRAEIVAALVAALGERVNIALRNAAVEALIAIGPDSLSAAVDALAGLDADGRKLAVEVLGGVPDLRGVLALQRALEDDDANVRAAAAEALGGAGVAGEEARELAVRALTSALATSEIFVKVAVLDSLVRLEAQLPWKVFEPFARDPILRRYAIAGASGSREPEAVRALAHATGDESPTISREALIALGEALSSSGDPALADAARRELENTGPGCTAARVMARDAEDTRGRNAALLVLGVLRSAEDVGTIARALADDDVAERADLALRMFGPEVAPPMLDAVRSSRPTLRVAALSLAASLEGVDQNVLLRALRDGLDDASADVVACAVEALGRHGEGRDLKRLSRRLGHQDERVAAAAARAVTDLAARNVDAARDMLRDSNPEHDPLALGCLLLGAIASAQPLDAGDVRLLERAAAHDDPRVRRAAIDALAHAGGGDGAEAVVFALADEELDVQVAAARALGRLGRTDALVGVVSDARDPVLAGAALRALGEADPARALVSSRPLVSHTDAAIACAAVEAIGQLATSKAAREGRGRLEADCEDALFTALEHPSDEVVKLALSLVGAEPGARALARLGLCLDHPSWQVRRLAAELLGQDGRAEAEGLLRARFERERDPIVRDAIASAVSVRPSDFARPTERSAGTEGDPQGGS
jgi:HEAT repeat protein